VFLIIRPCMMKAIRSMAGDILVLSFIVVYALAQPNLPSGFTMKTTGQFFINTTEIYNSDFIEYWDSTVNQTLLFLTTQFGLKESSYCGPNISWESITDGETLLLCLSGKDCDGQPCECDAEPWYFAILKTSTKNGSCTFMGHTGDNWSFYYTDGESFAQYDICVDSNTSALVGWRVNSESQSTTVEQVFSVTSFDATIPPTSAFQPPSTPACPTTTITRAHTELFHKHIFLV